ncbi:unnamed protein product, partial [Brenthis ino]
MWNEFHERSIQKATSYLGISNGLSRENKDPILWDPEVQEKIRSKKTLYRIWQSTKSDDDRTTYRDAKRETKRAVAQIRARSREGFYAKLENANNDKQLFKIAKQRHRDTQDTRAVKYIKDLQGNLLTSDSDINDRWREYYAKLLNETHPCEPIMELPTVKGPWPVITPEEVKLALSQMANNKATGPDDLPAELWKKLGDDGKDSITKLGPNRDSNPGSSDVQPYMLPTTPTRQFVDFMYDINDYVRFNVPLLGPGPSIKQGDDKIALTHGISQW